MHLNNPLFWNFLTVQNGKEASLLLLGIVLMMSSKLNCHLSDWQISNFKGRINSNNWQISSIKGMINNNN